MPLLSGICPKAEIRTTNPFDHRGWRWDLQADIREPRVAVELAFTLIPETHESQPFFSDAARHWLASIMISFMLSGDEWTFADLIRTIKSEKRIKAVLKRHAQTRDVLDQYFTQHDQRLTANILSTCAVKCLRYEPVAAAWDAAQNKFSLTDWVQNSWVLVLGNSEESRTPLDCINQAIFKRASDLVLNQSESFTRRSWFILDELAEAPKLNGLVSLLKKGRSKGACVAMAFQSISGLRDNTKYGKHFADEVLGQVGNRFFGRLECVETADWASRLFGDQEYEAVSKSTTNGPGGRSVTTTTQTQTRKLVLPGEFMSLPTCSLENGLHGFNLVRSVGAYKMHIPGDDLFNHMLAPHDDRVPAFVPRPVSDQYLRPSTKKIASGPHDSPDSPKKRRKRNSRHEQSEGLQRPPDELDDLLDAI